MTGPLPSAGSTEVLSAADVIYPGPGDEVRVMTGKVLVFALDGSDRRIPITELADGDALVGCAPTAPGVRMLVTGLPGTEVRRGRLDPGEAPDRLLAWVQRLSDAVSAGRWPRRLVPVGKASSMLAPGEHVGGATEIAAVQWVQVTSGEALLCGAQGASQGPLDPPLPLVRGAWLTAGLRCRVVAAPAPADPESWAASLDLLGRLALAALAARRRERDRLVVSRLEARSKQADLAGQEAVDALTAAVGGTERIPTVSDERRSAELAAAAEVARAAGLQVDDAALTAAAAEVESGRDPVLAVAGACGARTRPVGLEPTWWQREGSPLLVRLAGQHGPSRHPAAAIWRGKGWVLLDPRSESGHRVDAELAERIDRQATELLPVLPTRPSTLADLGRLALRGSRRELFVIALVTVLLASLSFVTPFLLGQLSNLFIASSSTSAYVGLFGALLLVVVAGTAWQAVRALALLRARSQGAAISAGAVWERLMRQRAAWHAGHPLGDRSAQATAVNNASAVLPDETIARLLDTTAVLGSLAAVATTNSVLLVSLTLLLCLQLAVTLGLLRLAARRAAERVDAAATATGRLMEILRAVNRLRIAGAESRAFLRWAQVQAPFSRADQELRRITMLQGLVIAVWPVLALVVVVAATAATGATFGEFVTAQTAASGATLAVAAMVLSANGALVARQSLRKAAPVLASVPEGGADGVQPGLLSGGLEVRDLVFRYAPDLPPVLEHVSLTVRPGEHVAIIGPSGCGKTTLMRILLGLEEPESGTIAVDGRDLATLNRPAVRRQIGSVLQSSSLLPCTIKENVDMGRAMTQDQIWEALDAAAVGADVRAMAMGLDTPVTDGGGTLSGGQRQRVLIARALAGNPRMLVLDEATSALDNLTQAAVIEALEGLRITRIVVAHRLSTIRGADRIVVLVAGRVVDQGTYDELMERPGPLRELAQRQQV